MTSSPLPAARPQSRQSQSLSQSQGQGQGQGQTQTQTQTHAQTQPHSQALALPNNPLVWSVADVCCWARAQPLVDQVVAALHEHAVDGHVLINYVTNAVLADELGIAAFGTRVHVLEAIETLRWNAGLAKPRHASPHGRSDGTDEGDAEADDVDVDADADADAYNDAGAPAPMSQPRARRPPQRLPRLHTRSPESDQLRSSKEESPDASGRAHSASVDPGRHSKRSASRIADAEKKRQKRAELKKNPELYAEYLQKERERNARRRARLRAQRGGSNSSANAHDCDGDDVEGEGEGEGDHDHDRGDYAGSLAAAAPGSSANNYAAAAYAPPEQPRTPIHHSHAAHHHLQSIPAYAPYAAPDDLPRQALPSVNIHSPFQPPTHNLRRTPLAADPAAVPQAHAQAQAQAQPQDRKPAATHVA
ncbi:hypothetical protein LPJ75_000700 [Coemansia sp. RSA 2598]|nr:hypothetical protein LPJ75_000700 [Coemansia sp. RSA 2598]